MPAARAVEDPLFSETGIPSNYAPAGMDPRVPTPEKVLGFRVGDRFATHAEVAAYVRAVTRAANGLHAVEPMRVATRTISGLYDGAILAASVHMGKHEPEMVEFVKRHRDKLEEADAATIEGRVMELRGVLESSDVNEIRQKTEALQEASHKLAETVYASAQQQASAASASGGNSDAAAGSDDEVVEEGDYEVIDEEQEAPKS